MAAAPLKTRLIDTLSNLITGLGIEGRAKTASQSFAPRTLSAQELENAYRSDWIARKVIDIPPTDMTREWRGWQADAADVTALEEAERTLGVRRKLRDALKLDRLCGGSLLVMGGLGGAPSDPVNVERLGKGALRYLILFNRYQVSVPEIDRDPLSPFYGEPKFYLVNAGAGSVALHPSRVVRFAERAAPELTAAAEEGWGDPLLQSLYDAVAHAGAAQQAVAELLSEAKIDVVSVPNLMSSVASSGERQALLERFALAGLAKGGNNVLLLDKEEAWNQKQIDFTSLTDIAQMFLQVVAAASDIPVTRMLGESPKGLSATGDMDLQNYYDGLRGVQTNDLRPKLDRLDEVLVRSALGAKPADLWWEFAPLWQMSDKDKAEIAYRKAQTTQLYISGGVLAPDALVKGVQSQLVEDGTYPGLEQFIAESQMEAPLLEKGEADEVSRTTRVVRRGNVDPKATDVPVGGVAVDS